MASQSNDCPGLGFSLPAVPWTCRWGVCCWGQDCYHLGQQEPGGCPAKAVPRGMCHWTSVPWFQNQTGELLHENSHCRKSSRKQSSIRYLYIFMSLEKNIYPRLFSLGGYYMFVKWELILTEKRGKSGNKTKTGKNNPKFCSSLPTNHIFSFL